MKIISETNLTNFEWWGPARENVKNLTFSQLDELDEVFDDQYPNGISATALNDIMAYQFDDVVAPILGIPGLDNEDDYMESYGNRNTRMRRKMSESTKRNHSMTHRNKYGR